MAAEKRAKGERAHQITQSDRKTAESASSVEYSICKYVDIRLK